MDPSETPVVDSSGFSYLSVQALFPKASQRAEIDWKVFSVPYLPTVSTSFVVNYASSAILLTCSGSYSFLAVSPNLFLQSLHPFPRQVHQPLVFTDALPLIHRSPHLEPQSTLPLQEKGSSARICTHGVANGILSISTKISTGLSWCARFLHATSSIGCQS